MKSLAPIFLLRTAQNGRVVAPCPDDVVSGHQLANEQTFITEPVTLANSNPGQRFVLVHGVVSRSQRVPNIEYIACTRSRIGLTRCPQVPLRTTQPTTVRTKSTSA